MTAVTVKYRLPFASSRPGKANRGPQLPAVATEADPSAIGTSDPGKAGKAEPPTRISRMLALAYFVERQVEAGAIKDYAQGARLLGISRARMAQLQALADLSPRIQEAILLGTVRLSERRIRPVLREVSWEVQDDFVTTLAGETEISPT